jgi:glycine oxidase
MFPALVEELAEETGVDVEYVARGSIRVLFTAADVRDAERQAKWARSRSFGIEAWGSEEIRAAEPALSPAAQGAMFVGADWWLRPDLLVKALAAAAVRRGVDLRPGSEATAVVVEEGRCRGLVAGGERIEADAVLLAAGAWCRELLEPLGLALPIEPRRGQIVALRHDKPLVNHCIHAGDVYLVPRPGGELLIGATVERVGFERAVTAAGVSSLLSAAISLVPALGELAVSRTWYGFRPWVPDSLPVLGPWPGVEGLWIATAHFMSGILLGPLTARLMAQWLTSGAPGISLADFTPGRWLRRMSARQRT